MKKCPVCGKYDRLQGSTDVDCLDLGDDVFDWKEMVFFRCSRCDFLYCEDGGYLRILPAEYEYVFFEPSEDELHRRNNVHKLGGIHEVRITPAGQARMQTVIDDARTRRGY